MFMKRAPGPLYVKIKSSCSIYYIIQKYVLLSVIDYNYESNHKGYLYSAQILISLDIVIDIFIGSSV